MTMDNLEYLREVADGRELPLPEDAARLARNMLALIEWHNTSRQAPEFIAAHKAACEVMAEYGMGL